MKKTFAAILISAAWPALAQDAYVVGVSAAMTGPGAGIYAPVVDAMKASPYTLTTRDNDNVTLKTLIHASVSYST